MYALGCPVLISGLRETAITVVVGCLTPEGQRDVTAGAVTTLVVIL